MKENDLGEPFEIWGPYDEMKSQCLDGNMNDIVCTSKKKFVCGIKVCGENEFLHGDQCVYVSKQPGDIHTKPECSSKLSSFISPQNMLYDIGLLYAIGAYFKHLGISGHVNIAYEHHLVTENEMSWCFTVQNAVVQECSSSNAYYSCYIPIKCSAGAIENDGKCMIVQDVENYKLNHDKCTYQDYHLPTFENENEHDLIKQIRSRMNFYGFDENQSYQSVVGALAGMSNKKINWASGVSNFSSNLFSYENLIPPEAAVTFPMNILKTG